MSDRPVFVYEATANIIREAVEFAYGDGQLSEDDYADVVNSLAGVPRNAACPNRVIHRLVAHVCDPEV